MQLPTTKLQEVTNTRSAGISGHPWCPLGPSLITLTHCISSVRGKNTHNVHQWMRGMQVGQGKQEEVVIWLKEFMNDWRVLAKEREKTNKTNTYGILQTIGKQGNDSHMRIANSTRPYSIPKVRQLAAMNLKCLIGFLVTPKSADLLHLVVRKQPEAKLAITMTRTLTSCYSSCWKKTMKKKALQTRRDQWTSGVIPSQTNVHKSSRCGLQV